MISKRILGLFLFCLIMVQLPAQTGLPLRLHIQPSKNKLLGDGDDQATLTITARDEEGEILSGTNGTVKLQANTGRLSLYTVPMRDGIAEVILTAPILNNEGKGFQRSIELTMKILDELTSTYKKKYITEKEAAKKVKKMMKEGPNTATLETVNSKDPFVYIIATMDGAKGKAKIEIEQAMVASSQLGGIYKGSPIATDQIWTMTLSPKGKGFYAEIQSNTETEIMTLIYEGEKKAGMAIVYIFEKKELEMIGGPNNTKFKGMPTAMKMLPGNALYLMAPPVLFRKVSDLKEIEDTSKGNEQEEEQVTHSSIIAKKNMLLGDGESQTQVIFRCVDKKNRPRRNVAVSFSTHRGGVGGKISKAETKTDTNGLARLIYHAPEMKVTNIQRLGSCKNEILTAQFKDAKGDLEFASCQIGILKCADGLIRITKTGFETDYKIPVVFGSPFGEVKGKVNARYRTPDLVRWEYQGVADADVTVECEALSPILDTIKTETDEKGEFKIQLHLKNWPYYWKTQLKKQPEIAFQKVTERRANTFTKKLHLFKDKEFEKQIHSFIYLTHKKMCRLDRKQTEHVTQKLHLFGLATEVFLNTRLLLKDTGGELTANGWSMLKGVFAVINQQFKLTAALEDKWKKFGYSADEKLGLRDLKIDKHRSFKSMIYRYFRNIMGNRKWNINIWDKKSSIRPFFRWIDDVSGSVSKELQKFISIQAEALAKYLNLGKFPANPIPSLIMDPVMQLFHDDVKQHFKTLIFTPDDEVGAWFDRKRAKLIVESAALRDHYIQIAQWRMAAEDAKAFYDLASEVVLNSAAIYAIATGNIKAVQLINKLKKYKTNLDAAVSTCGFFLEWYNYYQLKTECLEVLKFPKSSSTNTIQITSTIFQSPKGKVQFAFVGVPISLYGFVPSMNWKPNLFQEFEDTPETNFPDPPSFKHFDFSSLQAIDGLMDTRALGSFLKLAFKWQSWQNKMDPSQFELMATKPEIMGGFLEKDIRLGEHVDNCLFLATTFELKSGQFTLSKEIEVLWNKEIKQIKGLVPELEDEVPTIMRSIRSMENRSQPSQLSGRLKNLLTTKLVLISLGVIVLLMFIVILIVVMQNKKKKPTIYGPHLVLNRKQTYQLAHPVTQLGSDPRNQVVLNKKGAAPFHARICQSAQGTFWIEVMDPGLWLILNKNKGQSFWLEDVCSIHIGQNRIQFRLR